MKNIKYILFTIYCICVSDVLSGDYTLYISNEKDSSCIPTIASYESEFNPIRTSEEVNDDLNKYFCGQHPELKALVSFFGNGHLVFCSNRERDEILAELIDILTKEGIIHLNDLYDFLYVLGSDQLLMIIDVRLNDNKYSAHIKERLNKAKNNVRKSIKQKR